jgi:hypothetical protein
LIKTGVYYLMTQVLHRPEQAFPIDAVEATASGKFMAVAEDFWLPGHVVDPKDFGNMAMRFAGLVAENYPDTGAVVMTDTEVSPDPTSEELCFIARGGVVRGGTEVLTSPDLATLFGGSESVHVKLQQEIGESAYSAFAHWHWRLPHLVLFYAKGWDGSRMAANLYSNMFNGPDTPSNKRALVNYSASQIRQLYGRA